MPHDDNRFRPAGHQIRARRRSWAAPLLALTVLLALAAAAWIWWSRAWPPAPLPAAPAVSAVIPPAEPAIRHPLDQAPPTADIPAALEALLGSQAVERFLQVTEFPRRFVSTVDNLGREHAPPHLWPVNTTPGRFSAEGRPEQSVLSETNAARYRPFVALAERLDVPAAAALYRSIYPQLQAAYEELGFRNRYLNDRVVEVVDLLLATPQPQGPVQVRLLEIKGPVADPRPWVRWEFVDPALQSLTAGQKIMLRMGADNQQRLKRTLTQLRAELARDGRAELAGSSGPVR
ncbi:DUF3014 domain-containing protein [Ramlibacter sp. AN1015]|uniref:DUF3014 domain-containing protein n=1 Tax=Ramlibacter sp. AN1015 TaxID=3133428 RepID=UPI0030BBA7FA